MRANDRAGRFEKHEMRCAHFDCFSGIAGDMTLAALIDAGCPLAIFEETIAQLDLSGVSLEVETVQRHGIRARRVQVHVGADAQKKHRHLPHILKIIDRAGLSDRAAARARRIFERLAEAEAHVHGTSADKVHFHEVGADDAIVDIVCACVGLEQLGIESITCSPIATGNGTVRCAHGVMPVPAPATAILLKGVPLQACDEMAELTTPTGAAIITTVAESYGPLPAMRIAQIGYGTGQREGRTRPNLLRLLVGESAIPADCEVDTVIVLETQIDDSTGQSLANAAESLLAAGALDAYIVPIIMKKGRPGHLLTVLSDADDAARLEDLIFERTSTFGIRRRQTQRVKLARRHETVTTRFGPIRVKIGIRGEHVRQARPEYEDCAAAARAHGVSLEAVQQEACVAWRRQVGDSGR